MITQTIKKIAQALLLVPMVALVASAVPMAVSYAAPSASDVQCSEDVSNNPLATGTSCSKGSGQGENITDVFRTVINIMLFVVGAVAVIMLVIGGIRYVISNGDQNAVSGAKNTILYAIIGIVVAFLAFAAVDFVTGQLTASTTTTP